MLEERKHTINIAKNRNNFVSPFTILVNDQKIVEEEKEMSDECPDRRLEAINSGPVVINGHASKLNHL